MSKEELRINLVNNVMSYLKNYLLIISEELPIFNSVLNIMENMNDYEYLYTLTDIDEKLHESLMKEILKALSR